MNILITGSTGYIGIELIQRLITSRRLKVFALYNKKSKNYNYLKNKISESNLYLVNRNKILKNNFLSKNKIRVVLHLATKYSGYNNCDRIFQANFSLPYDILQEINLNKVNVTFINIDTFLSPKLNYYSLTKYLFKQTFKLFDNINFINIRTDLIVMPKKNDFINKVYKTLKNNKKINLTKGTQKRSFLFYTDFVDALYKVIENYKSFNKHISELDICADRTISFKSFLLALSDFKGFNQKNLNFGSTNYRKFENMNITYDNSKIKKLSWTPQVDIKKMFLFFK